MDAAVEVVDADLRSEVAALLAAYGHAIDRCDAEAWAALFHPDGTSVGPGRPSLQGTADLRRWVQDNPRPDLLHVTTNVSVQEVDGAQIHVASHFLIVGVDGHGRGSIMLAGSYADVLVRFEGELRFLSRTAHPGGVITPDSRAGLLGRDS